MSRKRTTKNANHQALAANLRRLRVEAGLTQLELAERTGAADATISRLERGRLDPSTTLLQRLASGLRVSVEDLLSTKPERRPTQQRSSVARLVALTDGLSDAQVDDITKAIKLMMAVGKSAGRG